MRTSDPARGALRRMVLVVAGLNLLGFVGEASMALSIGSVALFADSVDFLEDTSITLLIALALGWSLARRALAGRVMAAVILVPALAAAWQAVAKAADPVPPDVGPLALTAGAAALLNTACAVLLARVRHHGGSLGRAAFLSARGDVVVNVAIIGLAAVTAWTGSGWPDIVLGVLIVLVNGTAALEVWRLAGDERLAARALAGEDVDS
ncbi:MAG: cation transporter [Dermatophilaceae bacterium]